VNVLSTVDRRPLFLALALACGAVLALPAQAQTAELVRLVNDLRAPGGVCSARAPALTRRRALDAMAAQLARGVSLDAAMKSAQDRMTEVQILSFSGPRQGAQVEAMLASRFCPQIAKPTLTAVGVFAQGPWSWVVLAEPFAPAVGLTQQQVAQRMLVLVNAARAEPRRCGGKAYAAAPPVRWNGTLERAASGHARDMAVNNYFSHTGRDGASPAQRVARAGYRYRMTGENIAAGQMMPDAAVRGWIKSPGHCANLMNSGYTDMAVSFAVDAGSSMGVYWVQQFGAPQ